MPATSPRITPEGARPDRTAEGQPALLRVWVEAPAAWLNSNDRRHRMAQAKLVKAWRAAAADAVPPGWPPFDHPVRIVAHIWKARNGAYDAGNLYPSAKACIDGFRDAGILVEDSNEYVIGPDMRHGGKGVPGLIFTFTTSPQITPTAARFTLNLKDGRA